MDALGSSTLNQHFKKRKARTSSAPISPRRAAVSSPIATHASSATSSRASSPAPVSSHISADGINLSAALTALKVSLKREMESFLPPTPAASPIHSRSAKRPRFDFSSSLPDPTETKIATPNITRPKASPAPKLQGTAFLSVSKSLQQELDRTSRPDSSDVVLRARKRRQQLSYFAIARAFHRAAHERELALVPATPVE